MITFLRIAAGKRARPDPWDGEQLPVQQKGVTNNPLHASSIHALTRAERIGKVVTKCDIQPNDIAQSLSRDTHSMFSARMITLRAHLV